MRYPARNAGGRPVDVTPLLAATVAVVGALMAALVAGSSRAPVLCLALVAGAACIVVLPRAAGPALPFLPLAFVPATRLPTIEFASISLLFWITAVAFVLAIGLWVTSGLGQVPTAALVAIALAGGSWFVLGTIGGTPGVQYFAPMVFSLAAGALVAASRSTPEGSLLPLLAVVSITVVLGVLEATRVTPGFSQLFGDRLQAVSTDNDFLRANSSYGRPLPFGTVSAIAALLALGLARPRYGFAAIGVLGLLLSLSRGPIAAFVVGLAIVLLLRARGRGREGGKVIWRATALVVVLGLAIGLSPAGTALKGRFSGSNTEDTPRAEVLQAAQQHIVEEPLSLLIGGGAQTTQRLLAERGGNSHRTTIPDNQWVQLVLDWGLVPLAAITVLLVLAFLRADPRQRLLVLGALTSALIIFGVFDALSLPPVAFFVGWCLAAGTMSYPTAEPAVGRAPPPSSARV